MTTTAPIYNGRSIREILQNLPANMPKVHRNLYIKNCLQVYNNENTGANLDDCETIRNANFNLINFYN